ncbi:hypothetical protein Hdeb2414_s0025g00661391 [Helianthus debilis subsp. tardiflorus]
MDFWYYYILQKLINVWMLSLFRLAKLIVKLQDGTTFLKKRYSFFNRKAIGSVNEEFIIMGIDLHNKFSFSVSSGGKVFFWKDRWCHSGLRTDSLFFSLWSNRNMLWLRIV